MEDPLGVQGGGAVATVPEDNAPDAFVGLPCADTGERGLGVSKAKGGIAGKGQARHGLE